MVVLWWYHIFSVRSSVSSDCLMILVAVHTIKRRITRWLMVAALERMYEEGSGHGLVWVRILVRAWSERKKSRKNQLGLLVCGPTWIREGTFSYYIWNISGSGEFWMWYIRSASYKVCQTSDVIIWFILIKSALSTYAWLFAVVLSRVFLRKLYW